MIRLVLVLLLLSGCAPQPPVKFIQCTTDIECCTAYGDC